MQNTVCKTCLTTKLQPQLQATDKIFVERYNLSSKTFMQINPFLKHKQKILRKNKGHFINKNNNYRVCKNLFWNLRMRLWPSCLSESCKRSSLSTSYLLQMYLKEMYLVRLHTHKFLRNLDNYLVSPSILLHQKKNVHDHNSINFQ